MNGWTETKFCYATGNPVNTKKVHLMINQPVQITVVLNNFVQSPIQTSELKRSVNFEMSFWCYRLDQNSNKSIVRISALKFFVASQRLLGDLVSNIINKEDYRKPQKLPRSPKEAKKLSGQKSLQYFCCYFGWNSNTEKTLWN